MHTQESCDVILHVTATDEMCQLFQFKYQMTPNYYSDEDKIKYLHLLNLQLIKAAKSKGRALVRQIL
jgi:hypothetical protein